MKRIIYIAAPYGRRRGLSEKECEQNVQRAILYARILITKGFIPIVPHLYHYIHAGWDASPGEDTWLSLCKPLVSLSDAVLRIAGESQGADDDVQVALLDGIPVFYSLEELEAKNGIKSSY